MYRILVVEDDEVISEALCHCMKQWGYETGTITDFAHVMKEFVAFAPQLVILDISLPFYNGYHWCTQIRKVSKVPIIFLSSATDNMNIVMAINMGGDDFIAKPFDLNVLMAKIQAILRRTYDFSNQSHLLEHEGAILNTDNNTISYHGQAVELTKNEFKILAFLMENKGKTMSRDAIMTYLWETDSFIDDNTLTVNVTRARKKLSSVGLDDYIKTKKGLGYLIGD